MKRCIGPCFALLCLAPGLVAQKTVASVQKAAVPSQSATESDDPTRIILDVTRVNILFTVTDRKGRFVTDLGKTDFDVVENMVMCLEPRVVLSDRPDIGGAHLEDVVVVTRDGYEQINATPYDERLLD